MFMLRTFTIALAIGISTSAAQAQSPSPSTPPLAATYGTPCGTALTAARDATLPNTGSITIDGPDGALFNLISVATGQGFFMMSFGCPCLVSPVFASVALPVDAFGDSKLSFHNPPPGIFTMQALTMDAQGGYHLSNGLQF